jgi:hypothetical protein
MGEYPQACNWKGTVVQSLLKKLIVAQLILTYVLMETQYSLSNSQEPFMHTHGRPVWANQYFLAKHLQEQFNLLPCMSKSPKRSFDRHVCFLHLGPGATDATGR